MMKTLLRRALLPILLCCGLQSLAQGYLINTIAGTGTASYNGDGILATSAQLNGISTVAFDASGNSYLADKYNNRIRKITAATGLISTIAGTGTASYTGDGGQATSATLNWPYGVSLDASGNIYITEQNNHCIRKITVSTGIITTIAGTGSSGFSGNGGAATAATLNTPLATLVDAAGNIYIVDFGNNRIRKITVSTGVISAFAGGGSSGLGDGGAATSAQLSAPQGIAMDASGNLYIADKSNGRIRKVNGGTGIITTVAGGGSSNPGDGGQATSALLNSPSGVALDAAGNIYISEFSGHRIRKVTVSTGIINTIAGTGISGFGGDGGPATSGLLNGPINLSVDASGSIYIDEFSNNRVRKLTLLAGLAFDGVDDSARSNLNTGITGAQPRTFEAWVKMSTASLSDNAYHYIMGSGTTTSGQGFNLYTYNGLLYFSPYTGDQNTGYTFPDANWHHVAVTYNGTAVTVYVDAVQKFIYNVALNTAAARLYLGVLGGSQTFSGAMDEVRLWNRALCQAEIQNNMNGRLPNPTSQTGLVAYYTFDQGIPSGTNTGLTTITDSSGNSNNGTLYNFALTGNTSNYVAGVTAITGNATAYAPATATATESITKTISGTSAVTVNGCGALLSVTPTGGTALAGGTTFKVTEDASVQSINGQAYVQRHYDIEPASNATTATANITLYFTQAEFTAFNTGRGTLPFLPVNTADAAGYKANLRITQYHGVPTGGNAPANYPATWGGSGPAHKLITPTSVTYNSTASRWEVTFPVTGFSGFFASTNQSNPLPIRLESFSAKLVSSDAVLLGWQVDNGQEDALYTAERSGDGNIFTAIGNVKPGAASEYSLTDARPLNGRSYYRLKVTGVDGRDSYSEVRDVVISKGGYTSVYPAPARDYIVVESSEGNVRGVMSDMQGRVLLQVGAKSGERIDISSLASGVYVLKLGNGASFKITKE